MPPSLAFALVVVASMYVIARPGVLRGAARAFQWAACKLFVLVGILEGSPFALPNWRERQLAELASYPLNRVWTLVTVEGKRYAVPGIHPDAPGFTGAYTTSAAPWDAETPTTSAPPTPTATVGARRT